MSNVVHDLTAALAAEFAAIHGPPATPIASEDDYRRHAAQAAQSALCLSGGGIRSATFCLGVLQSLAGAGLLHQFHYLSTVSGGGYIGGWLSALVRETGSPEAAERMLATGERAPAVQALREFTNYLTPSTGLFSADTWAGVVLYLRNLTITWLAFAPIFLLAVLATIFYRTALWQLGMVPWLGWTALGLGTLAVGAGTFRGCRLLPSHRPMGGPMDEARRFASSASVAADVVGPLLAWAMILPATLSGWLEHDGAGFAGLEWLLPSLYALAVMAGYGLAATGAADRRLYTANLPSWLMATVFSAGLIWLGLRAVASVPPAERAEALAVAAPLWLVLANVLQVTIHVALRPEVVLGDLDREWLARLSAVKLRAAVAWMLFAFCCLSLQRLAFHPEGTALPFWAVPIASILAGPAAAWIGKQASSRLEAELAPGARSRLLRWAPTVLGVVFGVGLLTVLGYLLGEGLGIIQNLLAAGIHRLSALWPAVSDLVEPNRCATTQPCQPAYLIVGWLTLPVQAAVAAVLAVVMLALVSGINVNRFTMHGVYRNRLTRAFLGAVRPGRAPDPFTGFDPDDNLRMATLLGRPGQARLFHVINTTLNLTATTRTAWAERKAASFTFTPLACGAAELGDSPATGRFVPTAGYAGSEPETGRPGETFGVTLATAITISGAAVSPNAGYHSAPVTAFLMTLFNVRLGAWLPNPAVVTEPAELLRAWPRQPLLPMLDDLFGRTTDTTKAIYLSDGGHFDNLGLYEMLRRRCRFIVVVDAGEDLQGQFADLGMAIRKARIDLQASVTFSPPIAIPPRGAKSDNAATFALGHVTYHDTPEMTGTLLYLKPAFPDDLPADVRAYGAAHDDFPHESTVDQWFTESQFESYRALGEFQSGGLLKGLAPDASIAAWFAALDVPAETGPTELDLA